MLGWAEDTPTIRLSSLTTYIGLISSSYVLIRPHFLQTSCMTMWPTTHTTKPMLNILRIRTTIMKQNSAGALFHILRCCAETMKNAMKYHHDQRTVEKKKINAVAISTVPNLKQHLFIGNKYAVMKYRHPGIVNINIAVVYTMRGRAHASASPVIPPAYSPPSSSFMRSESASKPSSANTHTENISMTSSILKIHNL